MGKVPAVLPGILLDELGRLLANSSCFFQVNTVSSHCNGRTKHRGALKDTMALVLAQSRLQLLDQIFLFVML